MQVTLVTYNARSVDKQQIDNMTVADFIKHGAYVEMFDLDIDFIKFGNACRQAGKDGLQIAIFSRDVAPARTYNEVVDREG